MKPSLIPFRSQVHQDQEVLLLTRGTHPRWWTGMLSVAVRPSAPAVSQSSVPSTTLLDYMSESTLIFSWEEERCCMSLCVYLKCTDQAGQVINMITLISSRWMKYVFNEKHINDINWSDPQEGKKKKQQVCLSIIMTQDNFLCQTASSKFKNEPLWSGKHTFLVLNIQHYFMKMD